MAVGIPAEFMAVITGAGDDAEAVAAALGAAHAAPHAHPRRARRRRGRWRRWNRAGRIAWRPRSAGCAQE
eukprot:2600534-Pleurochrysis_carterae.AAC.1